MNCGVGCRRGSDPALLWLWCRLAATAPIQPLPWESLYAIGAALKRKKKGMGGLAYIHLKSTGTVRGQRTSFQSAFKNKKKHKEC